MLKPNPLFKKIIEKNCSIEDLDRNMDLAIFKTQNLREKIQLMKKTEDSLALFAHKLKIRTKKKDWDAVVAITGEEGSGKSVLKTKLAKAIDPNYDFNRNELQTTSFAELEEKITQPKIPVICADEAIKLLYKMQWATKSQRYINQLYTLCRKYNKITLLCIPRFRDLNEFFRNHRVKFWIQVISRGTAVVFIRDWSPFAKDPWWMDYNQKLIDTMTKFKAITDIDNLKKIRILRKSKNFLTLLTFPDFTPEEKKAYGNWVKNTVMKIQQEEDPKEKILKDRLKKTIFELLKKNYSTKKIADIIGMSVSSINSMLKDDPEYQKIKEAKKLVKQGIYPKYSNLLQEIEPS